VAESQVVAGQGGHAGCQGCQGGQAGQGGQGGQGGKEELVTHGCNSLLVGHTWCLVGRGIGIHGLVQDIAEKQNRSGGLERRLEKNIVEEEEGARPPVKIGA